MVVKSGFTGGVLGRQGNPQLNGMQLVLAWQGLLGMADSTPRRHQVHLTRLDHLHMTQAVTVQNLALHGPKSTRPPPCAVARKAESG